LSLPEKNLIFCAISTQNIESKYLIADTKMNFYADKFFSLHSWDNYCLEIFSLSWFFVILSIFLNFIVIKLNVRPYVFNDLKLYFKSNSGTFSSTVFWQNFAMVNKIWPATVAGKAVSASACHIGGPNYVHPGQILSVNGI